MNASERAAVCSTYLLDDQLKHDLRCRAQVVDLNKFGFVKAVVWRQCAEERVLALVQRHRAGGVYFCDAGGGVVGGLQVGQALGLLVHRSWSSGLLVVVESGLRSRAQGGVDAHLAACARDLWASSVCVPCRLHRYTLRLLGGGAGGARGWKAVLIVGF